MSIRTPFNTDGSVDYAGVKRMVDYGIEHGCPCALLTAGDSHFTCLSDEEIAQLNRVVVEHTAGRVMTIACDWEFATPQAVSFARYCRDLGADILMARPADWANGATVASLVEHYRAVSDVMPVMIVTNIFQFRSIAFGMEVLQGVMQQCPNVLAIKEDLQNEFARQMCLLVHPKWAVFAGGGLRNHMNMHALGCDGFMCRFMNFLPAVSQRYWKSLQGGDLADVRKVIQEIELPLERYMDAMPGGRDAAVHGLMEMVGLCGRWRRRPYHSLTDDQMANLKAFVRDMGLL
jgi:4-hydroxy-tetrahydrodipicolinate synthase